MRGIQTMTIYDIAQEAGVSASMVSRVINNKPGVAAEKRKRIQELLDKYHYIPNEMARSLVTSNTRMAGILVTDIKHEDQLAGANYITRELRNYGYTGWVYICGAGDKDRVEGLRDMARHNVQAAVLMGSKFQSKVIEQAISKYMPDIPVFILNGYLNLPNVYGVLADIQSGMRECAQALIQKGRKHIVLVCDAPMPTTVQKEKGYCEAIAGAGLEPVVYRKISGSFEGGYETMLDILQKHPDTDAVICSLDIMACGVLRALWERKIRVPEEMAVVGCDNTSLSRIYTPKLSTLDTVLLDCSITIAHKLTDCIEGRGTNHRTMLFTSLIERETT